MLTPNFRQDVTTHIFMRSFEMNQLLKDYPDIID